jgi:hypothetical protein
VVKVIAAATVIIIVAREGISGVCREAEAIAVRGPISMVAEPEIAIAIVMMMMPGAVGIGMVPVIAVMGIVCVG